MTSPVRTPEGYKKNNPANLTGSQFILDGSVNPIDLDAVQVVSVSNAGGVAPLVANLPSAADLFGKGFATYVVTAGAGNESVVLTAQAGETVGGNPSFTATAPATYLVTAENETNILLIPVA